VNDGFSIPLFLGGFAIIFPLFWLLITYVIGEFGGWHRFSERFPDRELEPHWTRLHLQSAMMGPSPLSASYSNCLTLEICSTGLRLRVIKLFGPFSKPIFLPWSEIEAVPIRVLFWRCYELRAIGAAREGLVLFRYAPKRVAKHSRGKFVLPDAKS